MDTAGRRARAKEGSSSHLGLQFKATGWESLTPAGSSWLEARDGSQATDGSDI